MPIYEYQCKKCNAHVEVMQKMVDKPLVKCVKCGGRLEKQWSSTSFQLKGTGWYVTDYAAKKTDTKVESKDAIASSTEDKASKTDEKSVKSDGKNATTEPEGKSKDKPTSVVKKGSSKNVSSNTSGD